MSFTMFPWMILESLKSLLFGNEAKFELYGQESKEFYASLDQIVEELKAHENFTKEAASGSATLPTPDEIGLYGILGSILQIERLSAKVNLQQDGESKQIHKETIKTILVMMLRLKEDTVQKLSVKLQTSQDATNPSAATSSGSGRNAWTAQE